MDLQGPLGEPRELLWEFGWEDRKKGLPTGCVSTADGLKLAGERVWTTFPTLQASAKASESRWNPA